jgi:hypothetical protein
MKQDRSNSFDEDNNPSFEYKRKSDDVSKACLEIWYIYPDKSDIKATNSHNVTNILKELVEKTTID